MQTLKLFSSSKTYRRYGISSGQPAGNWKRWMQRGNWAILLPHEVTIWRH